MSTKISSGTVHTMPSDLGKALNADKKSLVAWEDISPLARNEWICWVTAVKKDETRKEHIKRTIEELKEAFLAMIDQACGDWDYGSKSSPESGFRGYDSQCISAYENALALDVKHGWIPKEEVLR